MNRLALALLAVTACGTSDAPSVVSEPAPKVIEKVAPKPPAKNELPAARDAEAAKLVNAGAACKVDNDDISLSCPENKAAQEYASKHQGVAVAATCAELVRASKQAVKLVAARCLGAVTSKEQTTVLGHVLDSIEDETNPRVQREIAWAITRAEAVTAKLEDRALALVEKLAAKPATEDAAGSVMATLFSEWGVKPPKRAQDVLLAAFQRKQGGMFFQACNKVRLVEDKAAACAAVAGAIVADSPEWWRALGAFNDLGNLGAPCGDKAAGALDVALGVYAKGDVTAPQVLWQFAEAFELTPELRKKAAALLTTSKAKAPDWKKKDLDRAIAAFNKPYEAPRKKS